MISASEARQISESISNEKNSKALQDVERRIKIASQSGRRFTSVGDLDLSIRNILKGLGYTVEVHNQYNETSITISW